MFRGVGPINFPAQGGQTAAEDAGREDLHQSLKNITQPTTPD